MCKMRVYVHLHHYTHTHCVCISVCVCVHICMCLWHICMCLWHICMCLWHICMCLWHICMCLCAYLCVSVCISVCVCGISVCVCVRHICMCLWAVDMNIHRDRDVHIYLGVLCVEMYMCVNTPKYAYYHSCVGHVCGVHIGAPFSLRTYALQHTKNNHMRIHVCSVWYEYMYIFIVTHMCVSTHETMNEYA